MILNGESLFYGRRKKLTLSVFTRKRSGGSKLINHFNVNRGLPNTFFTISIRSKVANMTEIDCGSILVLDARIVPATSKIEGDQSTTPMPFLKNRLKKFGSFSRLFFGHLKRPQKSIE